MRPHIYNSEQGPDPYEHITLSKSDRSLHNFVSKHLGKLIAAGSLAIAATVGHLWQQESTANKAENIAPRVLHVDPREFPLADIPGAKIMVQQYGVTAAENPINNRTILVNVIFPDNNRSYSAELEPDGSINYRAQQQSKNEEGQIEFVQAPPLIRPIQVPPDITDPIVLDLLKKINEKHVMQNEIATAAPPSTQAPEGLH